MPRMDKDTAARPAGEVACNSMQVFDGETGEPAGWFYGFHFYTGELPETCPRCGARLKGTKP